MDNVIYVDFKTKKRLKTEKEAMRLHIDDCKSAIARTKNFIERYKLYKKEKPE